MVPRAPGPLRPTTGWQRCACAGGADRLPHSSGGLVGGPVGSFPLWCSVFFGFQRSGRVFSRVFGGCFFSLTGFGGCGGCSCRRGMGTGSLLPCRAVQPRPGSSSIRGWRWYFPMAHLALAPAAARPPRAGRAAASPRFHGGQTLPSPVASRDRGGRGTRTAASVPHPAKCSRIPPARHRFSPTRCSSSCPRLSRGQAAALPRPPSGSPLRGRACGRQRRRKVKTKKRKITPSPGERSSNKGARSLVRGKPEPRGKTAMSVPAEPRCLLRAAEPGAAGPSRAGTCVPPRLLLLAATPRSVGPPQAKFQPRFEDGSLSLLVPSLLPCVFPHRGGLG